MTEKLRKLHGRKAAVVKALRELSDNIDDENRPMSEDEQKQELAYKDEIAQLDAAIKREEEIIKLERGLIDAAGDRQRSVGGDGASATGYETVPDPNQPLADAQSWESMGEFLLAVYQAAINPGSPDPRLVQPAAITGLGEAVGSEGGFLVQQDFVSDLMRRTYDNTQLLNGGEGYSGVSRVPLGANSNGVKIPAVNETSRVDGSRWGGVQAYWAAEGGTKTASKPDFRLVELSLNKLIGLCYATDELLQDATALEAIISTAFAEEFAFKIQDGLIRGTGAGQLLGALNAPCLVTVAKESAQTATTIVAANVNKMYARMWARGLGRSVWTINQDCWPELYNLADAGNNSIFLPPGGISARPYSMLLGRPVVPIEQASTLGTLGDIMLHDFSEYLYIDKGTMDSASSIHVKFTTDETAFRFVYRCDGEPAWNSAVTPYKGSNTQSPFVALATRA